jgi:hypothetical protein
MEDQIKTGFADTPVSHKPNPEPFRTVNQPVKEIK